MAVQTQYIGPMQPIIRRTITITITETWTITWQDGHETTWHATQEGAWPADPAPNEQLAAITAAEEGDDDTGEPEAADTVEDE